MFSRMTVFFYVFKEEEEEEDEEDEEEEEGWGEATRSGGRRQIDRWPARTVFFLCFQTVFELFSKMLFLLLMLFLL